MDELIRRFLRGQVDQVRHQIKNDLKLAGVFLGANVQLREKPLQEVLYIVFIQDAEDQLGLFSFDLFICQLFKELNSAVYRYISVLVVHHLDGLQDAASLAKCANALLIRSS